MSVIPESAEFRRPAEVASAVALEQQERGSQQRDGGEDDDERYGRQAGRRIFRSGTRPLSEGMESHGSFEASYQNPSLFLDGSDRPLVGRGTWFRLRGRDPAAKPVRIVRDFVGAGCIVVGEVVQALDGSLGLDHAFANPGHSPRGAERES
jgi:hypothetical protein